MLESAPVIVPRPLPMAKLASSTISSREARRQGLVAHRPSPSPAWATRCWKRVC